MKLTSSPYCKTYSIFCILLLTIGSLTSAHAAQNDSLTYDKNIVKFNAMGLVLRNFSFQYERVLTRRISANIGFRFMPKGSFPMLSSFKSLIDDDETYEDLKNLKLSNTAITPEIRFYFGKKNGPLGFYIAPYVRFASYKIDYPNFEYEAYTEDGEYIGEKSIPLNGKANTTTAGFSIGSQWQISKWVYLDWTILGPSYGGINGTLTGKAALNEQEQEELREALEDIEIPLAETTTTVDANGAKLKIKGPWAGIRTSLAIGIKF